jgi:hypothetical protein
MVKPQALKFRVVVLRLPSTPSDRTSVGAIEVSDKVGPRALLWGAMGIVLFAQRVAVHDGATHFGSTDRAVASAKSFEILAEASLGNAIPLDAIPEFRTAH